MEYTKLEEYAKVVKLLGNPIRLKIAVALHETKCRVGKLTECVDEKLPIVSQQLAILRKAGIIEGKRNKNVVNYFIVNDFAKDVVELVVKRAKKDKNFKAQ